MSGILLVSNQPKFVLAQSSGQDSRLGIHAELPMVFATLQGISLDEQVAIIRDTGTGWVRQRMHWDRIEPAQGQFDWAEIDEVLDLLKQEGLEPLIVIRDTPGWAKTSPLCLKANTCPPNIDEWTNFVTHIVERYGYQPGGKKLVRYWEIWNEPNTLLMFTGTVDQYFGLLKAANETIKKVDTSATILMGGVTHEVILSSGNETNPNWLDQLFAKQGVNDTFDIFNFHLYGVVADPETTFVKVNEFIVAHSLTDKPIWVTETNPSEVSEQAQADNLATWHQRIFDQGVERVFYFTLPNWCQINTTLRPAWCDDNVYVTERRIGGLVKAADIRTHTLVFAAYQEMVSGQPTPTLSLTPIPSIPGDINGDQVVNILDFQILSNNFGTSDPDSDLNGDGVVNILDFQILSNNFGASN